MRNRVILGVALIVVGIVGLVCLGRVAWDESGRGGPPGGGWGWHHGPMMRGSGPYHMRGPWGWQGKGAWALPPVAGARTVEIAATDFSFNPAEIQIKVGEVVNLSLVNKDDDSVHDIVVPRLRARLVAPPGRKVAGAIRPTRPGTYGFFCSVPGHRESGMAGRIVVTP